MDEIVVNEGLFKFVAPFSMAVCGPTSCGKTVWVYHLLKTLSQLVVPEGNIPEKILFCFSIQQPIYSLIRREFDNVQFYEGVPSLEYVYDYARTVPLIIILDDLANEIIGNQEMLKLFTQGMHHRNISVVFMTQNLYQQGKHARTIALNVKYLVLFANPRDNLQVACLGRQLFPGKSERLVEAYLDAVSHNHRGYILIDLQSPSSESYRLRTNVFPSDEYMIVYLAK
jgi:hypothetical protein